MFKGRLKPDVYDPSMFSTSGRLTVPILALVVLVWILSHVALKEYIGLGIFFLVTSIFYFGYARWKRIHKDSSQRI